MSEELTQTTVTYVDHPVVDASQMLDDPAEAAVVNGLVGRHEPHVRDEVGAWRWPLVAKHADRICKALAAGPAIDFGGALGPIGYGAMIVDRLSEHRSLYDVPGPVRTVFTSHTLEHIVDLHAVMVAIVSKLYGGGDLIVHVPTWRNIKLQDQHWAEHAKTFCLSSDEYAAADFVPIDNVLQRYGFTIDHAEEENANLILFATHP